MYFTDKQEEQLIRLAEAGANVNIDIVPGATALPPASEPTPPSDESEDDRYKDFHRLVMPSPNKRLSIYGVADGGLANTDKIESYLYHFDDVEVLDYYPAQDNWFKVKVRRVDVYGKNGDPATKNGTVGWLKLGDGGELSREPWE